MKGELARNIRMRLAYLGTTWEQLASLSGLNPSNVRAWVQRGNPRGETLEKLAEMLGVPAYELLNPEFNPRDFPEPEVLRTVEGEEQKEN